MLHSRKTDKKASVLTEQRGKNTPVAQQSHCEDKKDKLKEGRSSPLITLAVSLKKPGVIKERRLLPTVVTSGGTAAGSQGTILHAPGATLQPGVQTPANKGVHPQQQSSGASNVLQILNTPQDGRRTPTHSSLVTVLPPTPPNEPVVVQPVSQTVSRVVPKGLPGQLPMQRVQVFVKQVAAQPSKPLGVSPFSSPTFRIMKTSQILTPPIDKRVAPVSSPAKPEQPCGKTEQPLQKTDQPLEKPEHPPHKLGEPLQKPEEPHGCRPSETPATKDLSSTLTSLEDSSQATTKPSLAVATDDGARAEGDEEEIDVGETLITTSQDETDSQVEVVESEVEMKEDTKEGESLSQENLRHKYH